MLCVSFEEGGGHTHISKLRPETLWAGCDSVDALDPKVYIGLGGGNDP